MSQALYRKYRSQRFAELVGQDSVTRILRNSIMRERLSHAYLFCGPRGTGKTSVARIFAKAINCLNPAEGDACGTCDVCRGVAIGNAVDVSEIDAASNRGIDDIRELRERVGYAPLELKYKIYIIDEVHMITPQGFNALLKTLEEPPAHVIFCLCTTEAHKLPITILSRCIRFDFHRLPQAALAGHLTWMAGQEGFNLDADAATRLAELAEGSARDAISLLDQLMVFCDGDITLAEMHQLFQLGDPQLAARTVDHLAAADPIPLLAAWEGLVEQGADAGQFLLQVGDELKTRYLADHQAGWRRALEAVWQGINLLKYESFPAVLVELTLLNAQAAYMQGDAPVAAVPATAVRQPGPPVAAPTQRPVATPAAPVQQTPPQPPTVRAANASPPAPKQAPVVADESPAVKPAPVVADKTPVAKPVPMTVIAPPAPTSASADIAVEADPQWEAYLAAVKEVRTTAYAMLKRGVAGKLDGLVFTLEFETKELTAFRYSQNSEAAKALVAAAEQQYGSGIGVCLRLLGSTEKDVILKPSAGGSIRREAALPPEITCDMIADPADPEPYESSFDPESMEQAATQMSGEISTDADDDDGRPPTPQDFNSLFDPIDVDS